MYTMNKNGYMMVRYNAPLLNDGSCNNAKGIRLHVSPSYRQLQCRLKEYYRYCLSDTNISVTRKNLRDGWLIVNYHGKERIMLAIIPYSNKKILPISI